MKLCEHESRWQHLYEAQREARWRVVSGVLVAVARAVLATVLVVGTLLLALYAVSDCGNVREAYGEPTPTPATLPEAHPAASQETPADPEVAALAERFRRWQPTWVERTPGELLAVAGAIVAGCRAEPWPTPERCPDLTTVLVFRESSLHANAVGRRGELGLMQLLPGVATAGETREAVLDPERNVRLGLAHLKRAQTMCRFVGRGDVSTALGMYGSGRCRPYRGSRLVETWERQLRAEVTP